MVRISTKGKAEMTFSELKTMLAAMSRNEANALADRADVPQSTVAKIRKGHTKQPRINTFEALVRAAIPKRGLKHRKANKGIQAL